MRAPSTAPSLSLASGGFSDLVPICAFVAVCRAIQKKVGYAFGAGMHGVSFWTADVLYGAGGADSADARAMWRAATPPQASAGELAAPTGE